MFQEINYNLNFEIYRTSERRFLFHDHIVDPVFYILWIRALKTIAEQILQLYFENENENGLYKTVPNRP